ncbi:MAG TPA: phosphoribosyltransferase [Mycobacteriales bacterium]|nr:phosphoribosyltransferase [Mycobacteriales bacterium]
MLFRNRIDAGQQLAVRLASVGLTDPVVLGLPRGGIPVAWVVAKRLGAPLDVFVARKIGAPGHQELGIGAVAEGSDEIVITASARGLGLDESSIQQLAAQTRADVEHRVQAYRGGRALPSLAARDVVVVDDGLATGVTAEAALKALRRHQPRQLVLAIPVGAPETIDRLAREADRVVCVHTPDTFYAVGEWYDDFQQTTDAEVERVLPPRL